MRKLLLVSMFQNVAKLLKNVEPNLVKQTVTYIPTAVKLNVLVFLLKLGNDG